MLERKGDLLDLPVREVMTRNPKSVRVGALAMEALRFMEDHSITNLFVLEAQPRNAWPG